MRSSQRNAPVKSIGFPAALKSFVGFLEGTQKAEHTIKNYRLDLLAFQNFLNEGLSDQPIPLEQISFEDVEKFHNFLKEQGLKTNTRRRKLMTVRRFLKYLTHRKKLPIELGKQLPTPHKIEKIPHTVSWIQLVSAIRAMPAATVWEQRNRVLLWTLAESGCLVSEVTRIKRSDASLGGTPKEGQITFRGKSPRSVPVSQELVEAIQLLPAEEGWLFTGHNRHGSLGMPITSRGVELLVKHHAARLGFPTITPRSFRHSIVLHWAGQGLAQSELQSRLGLKSAYAFRAYGPLLAGIVKGGA